MPCRPNGHKYTHEHVHARRRPRTYIHTHTRGRTPQHIKTIPTHTCRNNTAAHQNNTSANGKQTIQTSTPEPPQHQPHKQQNYFMNPPTKANPIHQSLYHSTKASVSYSLPPAHRTAPLLYAATHKPAQHRSCIGTLQQEQNNKNNPNIISKNPKHYSHVDNQDTTTDRDACIHEHRLY